MATTIKVTPQDLHNASAQISNLAGEYQSEYEALFREIREMQGKWDGQDNQAYTKQVGEFKDDFNNMYELMDQYSNYLKSTAKAYADTQENIKSAATTLTN